MTAGKWNSLPKTIEEAKKSGWTQDKEDSCCKNGGEFYGTRFIVRADLGVGLLFDARGLIAGLQMLITVDIADAKNAYQFSSNPAFQRTMIDGKEYFQATHYIIHPSKVCDPKNDRDLARDGLGEGLYLQNGTKPSIEENIRTIPRARKDSPSVGLASKDCLGGMGFHDVFYEKEWERTNCTNHDTNFYLYDKPDGKLVGFGTTPAGRPSKVCSRFERPDEPGSTLIFGKGGPTACILPKLLTSVHFYFIREAAAITCPTA